MFEYYTDGVVLWIHSLSGLSRENKKSKIAEIAMKSGLTISPTQLEFILMEIYTCEGLYDRMFRHMPEYDDLIDYFKSLGQFQELEQQLGLPIEDIMSALYLATNLCEASPGGPPGESPGGSPTETPSEHLWTMDEILKAQIQMRRNRRFRARILLSLKKEI